MKKVLEYVWPIIGIVAVVGAVWLLFKELRGLSAGAILQSIEAIPLYSAALAVVSTGAAYTGLAWYDRIALMHLGRHLNWIFIALVSFTTYALSHNIGASMISGAMVRYRAYSAKGLSVTEVGILVGFASLTFAIGMLLIGGVVLLWEPGLVLRLVEIPVWSVRLVGAMMLLLVALYALGSLLRIKPLQIWGVRIAYPQPRILLYQLIAAPLEIMSAAAIIYFSLSGAANPGYFTVLGVFVLSFSTALLSHAPGGLGVLEYLFVKALPDVPQADVVAALLVFRLLYLLLPLAFAIVTVALYEKDRWAKPAVQ